MTAPRDRDTDRDRDTEGISNPFKIPRGEKLRRELVAVFAEQREAVLRYLMTGRKDADGHLPFHWPAWHDFGLGALDLTRRFTPLLTLTWEQAAGQFAPRVGLDPDEWSVVNPHTEQAIQQAALAFCDSMNQTTSLSLDKALEKTREALREGIVEQGEALPEITKRIHAIFDSATKSRARRIAWTETSRAVHQAQEAAAIASGVVAGWEWLISADACPQCVAVAARARHVRLGHVFAVVGTNAHYSQVKFPPLHPHCNCSVQEVLDTDEQPQWADTLHQPEPATDEETDQVASRIAERDEAIQARKPPRPPAPPGKPRRPSPEDPDWLPDLGGSKAKVEQPASRRDKLAFSRATKVLFGKHRTARELASLIGAPDDGRVILKPNADGTRIDYEVRGPKLDAFWGHIERFKGRVIHSIDRLDAAREYRGKPGHRVGTRIHGRMVYWGARLGVDELELIAARTDKDVGYIVWPIFGYDGPLRPFLRETMPPHLADHATIQKLLATEEGKDYWQAHGWSTDLAFDLARGSEHRTRWVRYWEGIPEAQRKPMEGESKSTEKPPRKPGELDPDGDYPNGLGLSNEDVIEGWRWLGEYLRTPEGRDGARRGAERYRDWKPLRERKAEKGL